MGTFAGKPIARRADASRVFGIGHSFVVMRSTSRACSARSLIWRGRVTRFVEARAERGLMFNVWGEQGPPLARHAGFHHRKPHTSPGGRDWFATLAVRSNARGV